MPLHKWVINAVLLPTSIHGTHLMNSLTSQYLETLTFTANQVSTLRSIGEYRGKQALFFKQSPETLKSLQLVAKIESSESILLQGLILEEQRKGTFQFCTDSLKRG